MDLESWKKKYFFLKNVLDMFEKYNNDVIVENGSPYTLCDLFWVGRVWYGSKYSEFCAKLMRNIRLIDDLPNEDTTEDEASEEYETEAVESNGVSNKYVHCSYLNKWIYYYIYKKPVPDDVIKEIFKITHKMLSANFKSYKCIYESLSEDYIEPYNVIKLSFLADNVDTILDILNNDQHEDYSAWLKYIFECAATYKKINKTNCPANYDQSQLKLANTCKELQDFKSIYEDKLSKVEWLRKELPKLDDQITAAEEKILLELEQKEQEEYNEAQNGFSSTLKRNLPTGAAAAAGTGALLLALNKFTPLGSWFRSGKRRTPEVENILEGGPSEELFLNDPYYMRMNSDTTSYNVGYGSTENY